MLSPEGMEHVGNRTAALRVQEINAILEVLAAQAEAHIRRGSDYATLYRDRGTIAQEVLLEMQTMSDKERDAVTHDVAEALADSTDDDLIRIESSLNSLPASLREALHTSVATTTQGILEIVRRDNLAMTDDAANSWLLVTASTVALVNSGAISYEQGVAKAVRKLADRGIAIVDYASGVRSQADVATRRHIRSQVNQEANRRTLQICEAAGVELVEVSSHAGARPSHAEWQGQVYSLHGDIEIDGVLYKDFGEGTGYYGSGEYGGLADRLCGVNCRHSFAPYVHGMERLYSPTPDEDLGYEPGVIYAATQQQRAIERRIRRDKRRADLLQSLDLDNSVERVRLGQDQAALRQLIKDNSFLARDYSREQIYELSGQPRALTINQNDKWNVFPQTRESVADTYGITRLDRPRINALQEKSNAVFSNLTDDEMTSFESYTTGEHNNINQYLYGVKKTKTQIATIEHHIQNIDSAINLFDLNENIVVFSGTNSSHYEDWQVGQTYQLNGYVSTSVRFKDAKLFYDRQAIHGIQPCILEIRIPEGTECIFVGDNTNYPFYQGELILKHGLKYRVLERSSSKLVLEVTDKWVDPRQNLL